MIPDPDKYTKTTTVYKNGGRLENLCQWICVCVVDGLHANLAMTGVPLSISLLLQLQGLSMDGSQWTAKQIATGFSVSFFGPASADNMGPRTSGVLAIGGRERGEN